eukprot:COSAG04_NODE_3803_length_2515_cov_1.901490_2_plen_54_part_00
MHLDSQLAALQADGAPVLRPVVSPAVADSWLQHTVEPSGFPAMLQHLVTAGKP